jgi:hypothetical protein
MEVQVFVSARLRILLVRARIDPCVVAQGNPRQDDGKRRFLDLWKGRRNVADAAVRPTPMAGERSFTRI